MANNYEYQTQLMNQQEEGACALNAQQQQQQQFESLAKIHCEEAIHQHQHQQHEHEHELQQQQQEQEHQLQQQHQQQHHQQQQQMQMQQFENVISSSSPPPPPLTLSETENFHQQQQKPYTNIAVKGQNIKSKLNPLAQEFYPSYMRNPKNGYTTAANQMPNVVAIAAAATHAQYGYLYDYDYNNVNGNNDWPTYDYDFVRYMDYERFMTNHMQRSNTVVPLVKNNYSGGSGSAAPPSASTSFQDQQSYEKLRKQRSFNRSYSSTSYNLRKQHKNSSKDALKENNTRSWYIDKKAEEKRMESWKCNGGTVEAYQDPVPTTSNSSKEEFFEAPSPENSAKRKELSEEKVEYKEEPPIDQNHTPRGEDRTTQFVQHKTKIPHKSKKQTEPSELSRKKLIMLYPSKRTESDLTQSSQDSMFTQPNSLEYTSDESFLAQINSETPKRIDDDKNLKQSKKNENIENRNENDDGASETTDSLEDFEMTTKPSEPKILDYSNSASPISVIEQVKTRKGEKTPKSYLEPRIAINRLKKNVEIKLNHKNKNTIITEKTNSSKKTIRQRSSSLEKGENLKEMERQNHKLIIQEVEKETLMAKIQEEVEQSKHKIIVHPPIKELKQPKTIVVASGKFFNASSDGSKDDSKASYKSVRSSSYGVDNDAIETNNKHTHKQMVRVTAGGGGNGGNGEIMVTSTNTTTVAHNKTVGYTGAIPKNKTESNKYKEQRTSEKSSAKTNQSSSPKSQREVVLNNPTNRKIQSNNEETPTKIARLATITKTQNSNNNKDEKSKLELWIQRPPNGIVANRVQIFANKPNSIGGKNDLHSYDKPEVTHKRHAPKPPGMQVNAERKIHKAIVENVLQPPPPTPPPKPASSSHPISIMKKTNASTVITATSSVGASGTTTIATVVERRSVVPKPIIKTQMRSTTNLTGSSPHKKLNQSNTLTTSSSTKKETIETKKIKSSSNSNSRNIQPTSSRSIKLTGTTKMSIREKSSSLKGVKAVIGSDGDNNAKVVSSKSCISLRPSMRKLENTKPSVTDTKASKKSSSSNQKTHYSREAIATTLRNLTKEKRRNPYTDPGTDFKIIQSTYVHK